MACNRYITTPEEKRSWLRPGWAYLMSGGTKRLIIRLEGDDVIYLKLGPEHPRKIGPDTYGRCRWTAFIAQMWHRPDNVMPICPLHRALFWHNWKGS